MSSLDHEPVVGVVAVQRSAIWRKFQVRQINVPLYVPLFVLWEEFGILVRLG